jgi:3-oxoacid CoA-transferase subunit A
MKKAAWLLYFRANGISMANKEHFMSIFLSSDFHGNAENELSYITKKTLIKNYRQEKFENIKYHIILGDGGFLWQGSHKTDLFNYKVLAHRPFPVLCVIGNHEPILGMSGIPEVDIGIGEAVYQIQAEPFVAYLKRGKIYTIDGFKMLVLGGALSVDKSWRKPGKTWWECEYWSEQEKQDVYKLIETESSFDCVLSHTGPHHINKRLFESSRHYSEKYHDEVAYLNDDIHGRIQFREWWCGHWHRNLYYHDEETDRGYQYLYRKTKILDMQDNKIAVYNEFGMTAR